MKKKKPTLDDLDEEARRLLDGPTPEPNHGGGGWRPGYLSMQEAADALGIGRASLMKLVRAGHIQRHQIKGDWKISQAAVRRYLESRPAR